jgi:hypothetical protein
VYLDEKKPSYFSEHPDQPVEKVTWRHCHKLIPPVQSMDQDFCFFSSTELLEAVVFATVD